MSDNVFRPCSKYMLARQVRCEMGVSSSGSRPTTSVSWLISTYLVRVMFHSIGSQASLVGLALAEVFVTGDCPPLGGVSQRLLLADWVVVASLS